jgi:RimJ/RimL family protein N-acetyltransferase
MASPSDDLPAPDDRQQRGGPDVVVVPERVETPRLVIRVLVASDAGELHRAVTENVEHLRPWMPWIAFEPLGVRDREKLIAEWATDRERGSGTGYGIFLDGRYIGGTGLHARVGRGALEIGYWIDRSHEGRGYVTETAAALTEAALAIDGVDLVRIHTDINNHRSAAVPSRLGYAMAEVITRPVEAPGEAGKLQVWRATPGTWAPPTPVTD